MKFSTEYKNIRYQITLEKENYQHITDLMGDKFNRLPNQTLIELKKGNLSSYNFIISSIPADIENNSDAEEYYTHYLSGVLLTSNEDELEEEVADYLEQEEVIETIAELREQYSISPGPHWRTKKNSPL